MQGAPMVAIEVISPANRPEHIDKKTAAYLQQGAAEVRVIYPDSPIAGCVPASLRDALHLWYT